MACCAECSPELKHFRRTQICLPLLGRAYQRAAAGFQLNFFFDCVHFGVFFVLFGISIVGAFVMYIVIVVVEFRSEIPV